MFDQGISIKEVNTSLSVTHILSFKFTVQPYVGTLTPLTRCSQELQLCPEGWRGNRSHACSLQVLRCGRSKKKEQKFKDSCGKERNERPFVLTSHIVAFSICIYILNYISCFSFVVLTFSFFLYLFLFQFLFNNLSA